jgi:hypothetical protein
MMSAGIFRQDNPYNTIMGRIGDLAMLSVAWTVFSIPVFTIGASTSAACEVAREIVEDTDEGVFRAFWRAFKRRFGTSCLFTLLYAVVFGLGAFYYAAYTVLVNWNFTILLDGYTDILEHGFSVGSLATLLYVLYEQFVRDKKASTPAEGIISTLIEGFVPSETVEKAAKLIAEAIEKDVTGEGAARAAEILSDNCAEGITEKDIKLLSKLIIETLSNLNEPKP